MNDGNVGQDKKNEFEDSLKGPRRTRTDETRHIKRNGGAKEMKREKNIILQKIKKENT